MISVEQPLDKPPDKPPERPAAEPMHWDNHRGSLKLTLYLAMAVSVFGLMTLARGDGGTLLVVGLAVLAYTWFTTPKQYLIYTDALVIVYGRPRVRVIPFSQLSHVERLSLPIGDRLRIRLVSGRRIMLSTRDIDTFHDRLDEALDNFHGLHSTERPTARDETPTEETPSMDDREEGAP